MGVRYNPDGPLRYANLVIVDTVVWWMKSTPPPIDERDTDEPYLIQMSDRSDLLSARKLASSNRAWIIMERHDGLRESRGTRIKETAEGRSYGAEDRGPGEQRMRLWPNDFYPGRNIGIPNLEGLKDRGVI